MGKISSEEVKATWGEWHPPTVEAAREHNWQDHAHHETYPVGATGVQQFKDFGEGHMLYMRFLKWMAQCFAVLTIFIGAPQVLLNILGNYYSATDASFERSTLGNFGMLDITFHKNGESYFPPINKTTIQLELEISSRFHTTTNGTSAHLEAYGAWNKMNANLAASIIDLVGCLAYFLFTMYLIRACRELAEEADATTCTINDYTVWLMGLPEDASAEEVEELMAQHGEVASVHLVRAYSELLSLVVERGKVVKAMDVERATMQKLAGSRSEVSDKHQKNLNKLGRKLAKLQTSIQEVQEEKDAARVVGAFVTFKEETGKSKCAEAYPSHIWARLFMKRHLRLRQQHRIRVKEAPEPSDVQFENIQNGFLNRMARRMVTNFIKYLMVLIAFAIISFASGVNLSGNMVTVTEEICAPCKTYADYTLGSGINENFYTTAGATTYAGCFDNNYKFSNGTTCGSIGACYECYCKTVIDTAVKNSNTLAYCANYGKRLGLATAAQIGTIVVIVIAGIMVKFTAMQASAVEGHHTKSEEAQSATTSIVLALFINTALTTTIANAYLPALQVQINKGGLSGILIQGAFNDLTPNWYKSIGKAIMISIILKTPIRFATLCANFVLRKLSRRAARKAVSQSQANELWQGPEFELAERYGDYVSEVFVGMFFGGGMPLFWFILAINFTAGYLSAKWELLRLSRRPTAYGPHLAKVVHDLLPWAALPHAAFSLWAFSLFGAPRSGIVPSNVYSFVLWLMESVSGIWREATDMTGRTVADRICQQNAAHHFIGFLFCLGALLAYLTLSFWISAFTTVAVAIGIMKPEPEELEGLEPVEQAIAAGTLQGLTTYDITEQARYRSAFEHSDAVTEWLQHPGLNLDQPADAFDAATAAKGMSFFSRKSKAVAPAQAVDDAEQAAEETALEPMKPDAS